MAFNLKSTVVAYTRKDGRMVHKNRITSPEKGAAVLRGHWTAGAVKNWAARQGCNVISAKHHTDYGLGGKSWQRGCKTAPLI